MAVRRRRIALYAAGSVAIILFIAAIVILVFTNTNWGRERVRQFALRHLERATDGEVTFGRLEGNLLRRAVLLDVVMRDELDVPLLLADTIATRFSLAGLLRQRIVLTDLFLVRPRIILDKPPGRDWNYVRIFRIDTDPPRDLVPGPPGWGDWIELRDVVIRDGDVTVRTEWQPPPDLNGAERERALRRALAGETREHVVRVPGGFQNVMEFRELNAALPHVIPTHPDSAGIPIEVARFSGIVQPFQPPVAEVRNLAGKLRIERDSLHFTNVHAILPGSRVAAEGVYALHSGELLLRMRGAPVAFPDMRWLYPPLPEQGGGAMLLTVERKSLSTRIIADDMNVRVGEATIEGRLDIITGDTLRLGDTDLAFARVDTRLLEDFFDGLDIPRRGHVSGRFAATGPPHALRLDADVEFDDAAGPASRVVAVGELGVEPDLRFRDLRLRFQPLHSALARVAIPQLPVTGMITGYANLTGRPDGLLDLDSDLTLRDVRTGVSRVRATGGIDQRGDLRLRNLLVRADPVRTDLLREYVPQLPARGTIVGAMRLDGDPQRALRLDGDLALNDPRTGTSRIGATGGITFNGEPTFDDMEVRLHDVRADLLRRELPDLPPGGSLRGRLRVEGAPSMLHVAGAVTHADAQVGTSTIELSGGIALTGGLRFRDLDLELDPLQMQLVRAFAPGLPIRGVVTGTATLNGAPAARIAARGDLVHVEAGRRSHITGDADVATGPAGWARVDVSLQPLALATAGAFVPGAGLQGTVAGRLHAAGRLSDLRLGADLTVSDGGAVRLDGTLDLASPQPGYDITASMTEFDISAVSWRAPAETRLTGSLAAAGRGTDPATMNARIAADLHESEVDDVGADRVRVRAALADGLATIDSSHIRLGTAEAALNGSFGLVAARRGELAFNVRVDSLHQFAPWMPVADTAVGPPAQLAGADTVPAEIAVADAVLGADSALIALATTEPTVPRDSLSGRLHAAGTVRGNIHDFDLDGRADMEDVVFGGTHVGRGTAEFTLVGMQTQTPDITLDGSFARVVAAGFAFDTLDVEGRYRGSRYGEGEVVVAARQADGTEVSADAAFTLSLERNEVRLADVVMRFDTVTWRAAQPAVIGWGGSAIEIHNLDLRSNFGGRIFADGTIPDEGAGNLELAAQNVDVGQVMSLLQQDTDMSGLLELDARITGTRLNPAMNGTAIVTAARVEGTDAPDVRIAFSYAGRQLEADAQLVDEDRLVAEARARLPIDLALAAVPRRLLDGELAVDVHADSLPIEAFPVITDQVEDVTGRISGDFTIRGSVNSPVLAGNVDLALGAVRVVPLEVVFRDVTGSLTLDGTTVTVDSIVARSGGTLRIDGTIEVATPADPVFDLALAADDALLISTEDLRLRVDADVTAEGSLSALNVTGDAHARSGMVRIPALADLGAGTVVNLDDPATMASVDTLLQAQRDALRERSRILQNVDLEIALTIDRDVWLRSPEANVEIYTPPEVGPLRIRSNSADNALNVVGTINTDRGTYEFMSRTYNLTRGAVTFTAAEEMDPLIQVAAEHEVRLPGREAFEIRVLLSGTLSDLAITLESTSQPPISQTDLLSYVAFGRDASSLLTQQGSSLSSQGTDAGELVGNVAAFATQQLATVALQAAVKDIEAGALRDLGLDVFRITPADVPAEVFTGRFGDVLLGTQVEAGRYISPRLFVAAQGQVGLGRPGIRAEYWTRRGFSFEAAFQPRFLPAQPTLAEQDARRGNVFGAFLFRDWRF